MGVSALYNICSDLGRQGREKTAGNREMPTFEEKKQHSSRSHLIDTYTSMHQPCVSFSSFGTKLIKLMSLRRVVMLLTTPAGIIVGSV
jgi:hypothetical protein